MSIVKRISGRTGELTVPPGAVAARIGPKGNWELRRAEPQPQDSTLAVWSLRAVFTYVNPVFFGDRRFPPTFTVKIGGKLFRLDMPPERMVLSGRSLQAEGVTLCQL